MSKQQLYINGKAVDMPKDEIKIKVESNIFSDADKIKTAHSYNIALPRTMTNDSILGLAYLAGAETGGKTTHKYLDASLYLDGVPLFEKGQAVLTSVDEKGYNLNLFWGLLNVFDEIKREGLDLCDLPMSSHWREATMGTWIQLPQYDDQLPQYDGGMTQDIYNTLDNDSKTLADELPWLMPSVSAMTILNKIRQVYGLTFSMSDEAFARINQIWHPLVTRNVMAKDEKLTFRLTGTASHGYSSRYYHIDISSNVEDILPSQNIFNDAVVIRSDGPSNRLYAGVSKVNVKKMRVVGSCNRKFQVWVDDATIRVDAEYNSTDGLWHIDKTYTNILVEDHDSIVALKPPEYTEQYGWDNLADAVIDVNINVEIDKIDDGVLVGSNYSSKWCYERNYPEIGIINYFSELLAHIGGCIIGSVTKPKSLRITTFDEIATAEPIDYEILGVEAINMTLDNLAQKNTYKHEPNEDDGFEVEDEAVIYTSDETLELERTAFDSNFKIVNHGYVRLWKIEDSETAGKKKATWVAEGDYIAGYNDYVNVIYNTGQDFASTIADYYTNYEKIINHPKEIEVVVRLSVLDLLNFDMARPVYITQLGRKYLIKSLEGDSGEKYKLTLVQI